MDKLGSCVLSILHRRSLQYMASKTPLNFNKMIFLPTFSLSYIFVFYDYFLNSRGYLWNLMYYHFLISPSDPRTEPWKPSLGFYIIGARIDNGKPWTLLMVVCNDNSSHHLPNFFSKHRRQPSSGFQCGLRF